METDTSPDTGCLTPIITIVGPTAAGKTALGIFLAQQFSGEIISADSRQFYQLMDIGTAKPTADERAAAPHHLIDFVDPDETVGLAGFLRLAREAIDDIAGRGKLPMVVGGTGQYVRALVEGWQVPNVPPDAVLREKLERQAKTDPEGLWQQLMDLDPDAEAFIDRRNLRRVIRALEVTLKSGKPFSALRRRISPPYRVLSLGLTMDRAALHARVDARIDRMMEAGLEAEVRGLVNLGYDWRLPAMSGLGYIQFRPYFEAEESLEEVAARIKIDTHDFIRRQYTWFRPLLEATEWLDVQSPKYQERARDLVAAFLK